MKLGAMVALSSFALSQVAAGQAVEWPVSEGGNGHWYELVRHGEQMCWSTARSAAEARAGYLVTFASSAEHAFVAPRLVDRAEAWSGRFGPWIGGTRVGGSWTWVTGEAWSFTAWYPGEPNGGGTEPFLSFIAIGEGGGCGRTRTWNDWVDCGTTTPGGCDAYGVQTSIVEYDADCDGNGLVDFGEIVRGEKIDANHNNVPDTCEQPPCPGDITRNGVVDGVDLALVLAMWATSGENGVVNADVNRDGVVDGSDLAMLLGSWGICQ